MSIRVLGIGVVPAGCTICRLDEMTLPESTIREGECGRIGTKEMRVFPDRVVEGSIADGVSCRRFPAGKDVRAIARAKHSNR